MKSIIVAIDGYAGTGKGTLARQLAQKLKYNYIDSGALYRAVTLYLLENKIDYKNVNLLITTLSKIKLSFTFSEENQSSIINLNGSPVEHLIRSVEINNHVSLVAELKEVRSFVIKQLKEMGINKKIVMDGRDIGTNIFPNAELKIFMEAPIEIRTIRRFKETQEKNILDTLENIKKNLQQRDSIDSSRKHNPLIKATDAVVIDNSALSIAQQFDLCYQLALKKINS